MKTFKDHSHVNGTYVSAKVNNVTLNKLDKWVSENGIKNATDPTTYHSTIVYSRKGVPQVKDYNFKTPITGSIKEWKLFPTQNGTKALVLIVKSDDLEKYHEDTRKLYGATWDYPDYHPHITISYDHSGKVPDEIPNIPITYDKIDIESLDPDFVPEKKK